jgi:hypothetical protein
MTASLEKKEFFIADLALVKTPAGRESVGQGAGWYIWALC